MGVLDRIARGFAATRAAGAATPLDYRQGVGSGAVVPLHEVNRPQWLSNDLGARLDAYGRNVILFACVAFRSAAVASAPMRVWQIGDDGDLAPIDPRAATGAAALDRLLRRPNPQLSDVEFVGLTQTMIDTAGFAVIEKQRPNRGGQPIALWHLRPDWLKPIPVDQRAPDWEYRIPGERPSRISGDDVIVVTGHDTPRRGLVGIPPVAVAMRELGIEDAATDYLKAFFDRGGVPQFALRLDPSKPQPPQAQAELIRESWQQTFSGWRSWLRPAILGGGIQEITRVGSTIDEMAYPGLRQLTSAQICSAYRVSPILVGALVGLEHMTYTNYPEARKHFYEDVASTLWDRLESAFSRALLPEFADETLFDVEFDTGDVVAFQEDRTAVYARAAQVWQAGIATRNEARRELGLKALDPAIGDVLLVPFTALTEPAGVEAPLPALPAPDDAEPEPDDNADQGDAAPVADAATADRGIRLGRQLGDGIVGFRLILGDGRAVRVRRLPAEARARSRAQNAATIASLAAVADPPLARYFRGQRKRVVGALIHERAVAADLEQRARVARSYGLRVAPDEWRDLAELDALDWDYEAELLERELFRVYVRGAKQAFGDTSAMLGADVSFDVQNPYVRRLTDRLGEQVVEITERTRIDVARVVTDWILDPEGQARGGIDALADGLRGLYDETYRNRSTAIARTESQRAYNLGNAIAYRESEAVAAAELADNPDHDTDPGPDGLTCAERNGRIVALEDVDTHVMAEHPNGTLAVLPVLSAGSGLGVGAP